MFIELRNKFLIINFCTILIIMILSFMAVFIITYSNLKNEIYKKLNIEDKAIYLDIHDDHGNITNLLPDSIMFTITLDEKNGFIYVDNPYAFNLSNTSYDYSNFVKLANSKIFNNNVFMYGDSYFAYKKVDDKIVFLDVTKDVKVLFNYIYSFFIVLLFTTITLFFFSKYFANKAILPIQNTFKKQKDFISDASHELKTPLTIINTNLDLVLSNEKETIESQKKWLGYAKDEINNMSKLINELLYLTKNEMVETKEYTNINFSELVENISLQMEAIALEKNIILKLDTTSNLNIRGDFNQITQVIKIILDNAIKFCNKNGIVTVNVFKQNNLITMSISNTGPGIREENIPYLFDRFYKEDESRNRILGGYGLGLSIAKNIIDNHMGIIKITSSLNEITTVTVSFKNINIKK